MSQLPSSNPQNSSHLNDHEKVYLRSVTANDTNHLRAVLEELEGIGTPFNYECLDYRRRSALHLAVENENVEMIEMLIDKTSYPCMEEALLHSINKDSVKSVRAIIEHPSFLSKYQEAKECNKHSKCHGNEYDQFPNDVTPLILAAQRNSHEVIQMFLSRNFVIDKPHWVSCTCPECSSSRETDSLKRSRSRLNAYRALVSPAYMALSSPDPIMTTFELRQEMKKLAQVEKEFKNEYTSLVEQCMDFACELMDLCRGTQEVEAVLSDHVTGSEPDPLARLKMALKYDEKKFVAHPNCQQHLTSVWYGTEMGFLQSMSPWKQVLFWVAGVPAVPLLCLAYLAWPDSKIAKFLKCPASKFIAHTMSNLFFLLLISMATFSTYQYYPPAVLPDEDLAGGQGVNELKQGRGELLYLTSCRHLHLIDLSNPDHQSRDVVEQQNEEELSDDMERLLRNTLRSCNGRITNVHVCLLIYVLGMMWTECKQLYVGGLTTYLMDSYNWVDFVVLSLYLSSYALKFLVQVRVASSDWFFGEAASRARKALMSRDLESFRDVVQETCNRSASPVHSYFMRASRFEWQMTDPEIVSDMLFGLANVWSIARTTYLMPAFEVLGPLQISLGRMMADITRFLVLFALVLLAFMVGLHNLYCYYGAQTFWVVTNGSAKLMHSSEAFKDLWRTLLSLFWSMFGLVGLDSIEIKHPRPLIQTSNHSTWNANVSFQAEPIPAMVDSPSSTLIVERVGLFLFALYHVTVIVVLINMLIAMMSHSFEAIQGDCDVEWKFARTHLWMSFIHVGETLPVPFNMIPSSRDVTSFCRIIRSFCRIIRSFCRGHIYKADDDDGGGDDGDDDYNYDAAAVADDDDDDDATCVLDRSRCHDGSSRQMLCCCCLRKKIIRDGRVDDEDDDEIDGEEIHGMERPATTDLNCFPCLGKNSGSGEKDLEYFSMQAREEFQCRMSSRSTWRRQTKMNNNNDKSSNSNNNKEADNREPMNLINSDVGIVIEQGVGDDDDDDDDDNDDHERQTLQESIFASRKVPKKKHHHYHQHHHHQHPQHREQKQQHGHTRQVQSSNADILQRLVRRYLFKLERKKDESAKDIPNSSDSSFLTDHSDFRRKAPSSHGSNQSLVLNFPPSASLTSTCSTHRSCGSRFHVKTKASSIIRRRRHQQLYHVQLQQDNQQTDHQQQPHQLQHAELQPPPKKRPFHKPPQQAPIDHLPSVNEPRLAETSTLRQRSSLSPSPSSSPTGHAPISPTTTFHLLTLPKIDAMVRSIRSFQTSVNLIGDEASKREALRDDIRHVEKLLVENCKALSSVMLVLKSIRLEVETLKTLSHLKARNALRAI